jgi:hypothetical protein
MRKGDKDFIEGMFLGVNRCYQEAAVQQSALARRSPSAVPTRTMVIGWWASDLAHGARWKADAPNNLLWSFEQELASKPNRWDRLKKRGKTRWLEQRITSNLHSYSHFIGRSFIETGYSGRHVALCLSGKMLGAPPTMDPNSPYVMKIVISPDLFDHSFISHPWVKARCHGLAERIKKG